VRSQRRTRGSETRGKETSPIGKNPKPSNDRLGRKRKKDFPERKGSKFVKGDLPHDMREKNSLKKVMSMEVKSPIPHTEKKKGKKLLRGGKKTPL